MPGMKSKPGDPERRRGKVGVRRGFSQMDWMRLANRPGADLTGLGPAHRPRLVTMEEVRAHKAEGWTVLRGRVYAVAHYVPFHPGGSRTIIQGAGKDMTKLFDKFHPWVNADFMLEKCLVGALAEGDLPEPESDDEEMLAADGGTDDTGDGSGDSGGGGGSAGGDEGARGRGVSSGGAQRPGSPIMGVVTP